MKAKQKEKIKRSFQDIMDTRKENPEFMTGKRFKKKRGSMGKLHKTGKKGKKH